MADDWDKQRDEMPTQPPGPEPTNRDIMNTLGAFASEIRDSVERIETTVASIETKVDRLEANYELIHNQAQSNTKRISELETRLEALAQRARFDS